MINYSYMIVESAVKDNNVTIPRDFLGTERV